MSFVFRELLSAEPISGIVDPDYDVSGTMARRFYRQSISWIEMNVFCDANLSQNYMNFLRNRKDNMNQKFSSLVIF